MKAIMVTGIGGGVGQGILRNIRSMNLDYSIVGTDISLVSAGNHLCDYVHQVPYSYDAEYISSIQSLITQYDIKLIIPSTDYEAYFLALSQGSLTATVAASPAEVTEFCLDKYLNFQRFYAEKIPFAQSFLPSDYIGQLDKIIAKPRKGRGSRDIFINPSAPQAFGDEYVIQEYLEGPELTTAFYVRQSGELHGSITLLRELEQGNTSRCEVVTEYDAEIQAILAKIVKVFKFRGSCNIQSRVTANGIIPFEINCRISGTNSIRSQFGFPDVAYTVQELLLGATLAAPTIRRGSALRIMLDVIYPDVMLSDITNANDNFRLF